MNKTEYPEWALKYKGKGMALRKKGNGYALLKVTSSYVKGSYPRLSQTYLGMITEDGFHPAKVSPEKEGASLWEWGLSSYVFDSYHRELQRSCYGASGYMKEGIIKLGIVCFAHGSVSDGVLRSCALTHGETEGLSKIRETVSVSRIEVIRNKIGLLFRRDFSDEETRNELIALLRLEMAHESEDTGRKQHSQRVREILEGGKE